MNGSANIIIIYIDTAFKCNLMKKQQKNRNNIGIEIE